MTYYFNSFIIYGLCYHLSPSPISHSTIFILSFHGMHWQVLHTHTHTQLYHTHTHTGWGWLITGQGKGGTPMQRIIWNNLVHTHTYTHVYWRLRIRTHTQFNLNMAFDATGQRPNYKRWIRPNYKLTLCKWQVWRSEEVGEGGGRAKRRAMMEGCRKETKDYKGTKAERKMVKVIFQLCVFSLCACVCVHFCTCVCLTHPNLFFLFSFASIRLSPFSFHSFSFISLLFLKGQLTWYTGINIHLTHTRF